METEETGQVKRTQTARLEESDVVEGGMNREQREIHVDGPLALEQGHEAAPDAQPEKQAKKHEAKRVFSGPRHPHE